MPEVEAARSQNENRTLAMRGRVIGGSLFVFALFVRIIYLVQLRASPLFDSPIMDPLYHHEWAMKLAGGDWLGHAAFFRAPLYPYLLGLLYALFGQSFLIPRLLQFVMGAASCVLVWKIGSRIFNPQVGVISGLVACLYGPSIYFEGELLLEPFATLLSLSSVLLLIDRRYLWAGIVLGLSAITRPNVLLFAALVPLLAYFFESSRVAKRRTPAWHMLLPWVGVVLIVAPVTIRNWVLSKDLVLVAWQGGVNFHIGNNPRSDCMTAVVPGTSASWWGGYYDTIRIAETETGRRLKPSEVSDFWFGKSLDFIRKDPILWLKLMLKKTWLFWQGWEISNNQDIYYFSSKYSHLLGMLIWGRGIGFPFGLVSPLALCGLIVALGEWRRHAFTIGFILLYAFSFILFFVCSRFRMPVIPLLIIYAAFFCTWLWERRHERVLLLWVPGLLLLALLLNWNFAHHHGTDYANSDYIVGSGCMKKGRYAEALEYLQKAVEENPKLAEAYLNIGNIHVRLGQDEKAFDAYRSAVRSDARFGRAYFNTGSLHLKRREYEEAVKSYLDAIRLEPTYEPSYRHASLAYAGMGDTDRAAAMSRLADEIHRRELSALQPY
ncbi:MAG: tetratricopeptide repeat protein [Acidobacteriota bacterium]